MAVPAIRHPPRALEATVTGVFTRRVEWLIEHLMGRSHMTMVILVAISLSRPILE